jgi:AcrR family transcriptional regulator
MGTLRERSKQYVRRQIAETALGLFLAQGFDKVTVAQVAAAAGVAEKTVYNYFPTKAHLAFDEDPAVLDGLVAAVANRPQGQSALAAVRGFLSSVADRMGDEHPAEARAAFRRMVADSPALQAHQRQMAAGYERALAAVLAAQTRTPAGAAEPFMAAVALVGALRAGFDAAQASGGVGQAFNRALDLLEGGLADYARAANPPPARP